jgi:hypothetical protein
VIFELSTHQLLTLEEMAGDRKLLDHVPGPRHESQITYEVALRYTSAVPANPEASHPPQFPTLLLWTLNNRNLLPNSCAGLLPPNKHQTNALKGAERSCIK